ncbi:hypothetical protein PQR08_32235 [Caballeronia jiangsuensis]|uniref:Lipoprotein n=1 Tax=Caballeronia jiangsuensis TaxID=1458357 RepID=A0ABW9CUG8_9BURK
MCKLLVATLLGSFAVCASASPNKEAREYKDAYACSMESFKSGYGAGPAGYCVGNSRDPSKLEERAYADAERDFRTGKTKQTAAVGCTFGYAVWQASGSHADDFLEGPQRVATMRETAKLASANKQPAIYDQNGAGVPVEQINHWFSAKKINQWETKVTLTPEALKTCSKKQIG